MGPSFPPLAVRPWGVGLETGLQTCVGDLYEIQPCKVVPVGFCMCSHRHVLVASSRRCRQGPHLGDWAPSHLM